MSSVKKSTDTVKWREMIDIDHQPKQLELDHHHDDQIDSGSSRMMHREYGAAYPTKDMPGIPRSVSRCLTGPTKKPDVTVRRH
jgi:hypothetical protein